MNTLKPTVVSSKYIDTTNFGSIQLFGIPFLQLQKNCKAAQSSTHGKTPSSVCQCSFLSRSYIKISLENSSWSYQYQGHDDPAHAQHNWRYGSWACYPSWSWERLWRELKNSWAPYSFFMYILRYTMGILSVSGFDGKRVSPVLQNTLPRKSSAFLSAMYTITRQATYSALFVAKSFPLRCPTQRIWHWKTTKVPDQQKTNT